MPQTIYKYAVPIDDQFSVLMPEGAEVLSVQVQNGEPQMWARVNPDCPQVIKAFSLRGTGHPMEPWDGRFIGTFQLVDRGLVFHLFEVTD